MAEEEWRERDGVVQKEDKQKEVPPLLLLP